MNSIPALMTASDVIEILSYLHIAGIETWLDGGWGIDALIGKQTRPHSDLDLVVSINDVIKIKALLGEKGFTITENNLPTGFAVEDIRRKRVDFHTVTFDAEGGGNQWLRPDKSFRYAPQGFKTLGKIDGHPVVCISAEVQAECHYGYPPKDDDRHDMHLLHRYFCIELKKPYL